MGKPSIFWFATRFTMPAPDCDPGGTCLRHLDHRHSTDRTHHGDNRIKSDTSRIGTIVHPSDFSPASEVAFAHALKLGLATHAKLDIMHVAIGQEEVTWVDFPGIRDALERWGVLPPGSPRSEVEKTGIRVRKATRPGKEPVEVTIDYFKRQFDLR